MSTAVNFSNESLDPYIDKKGESLGLQLFVKGMKCGHCIHKISKELDLQSGITNYDFFLQNQRLELQATNAETLVQTLTNLDQLGFEAIPLKDDSELIHNIEEFKSDLKKIAVAGVCAGNIMLFSTAVYFGADKNFSQFFHWLSFSLALPVLLYSGRGIWQGFFNSLKTRKFNLDLPLGLGIGMGFLLSLYSLFGNQAQIYFDSICVIVFIILVSRFLLKSYVQSVLSYNVLQFVPGVYQIRQILKDGRTQMVALDSVVPGDQVLVQQGETVPVDGKLMEFCAEFDESILTGESDPVKKHQAELVYAGTQLCRGEVRLEVVKSSQNSRVGQMISNVLKNEGWERAQVYTWVSYFTQFVIGASFLAFGFNYWQVGLSTAFERSFAMILIACPCAVSFGIPLIQSLIGKLARQNGILVKHPHTLKQLSKIKNIFFDKTGTLTHSVPEIVESDFKVLSKSDQLKLISLELETNHPISKGFQRLRESGQKLYKIENFKYVPGLGIEGEVDGELWEVQSSSHLVGGMKTLQVRKNNKDLVKIRVATGYKKNLAQVFKFLAENQKKISVISGDVKEEVEKIKKLIPVEAQGLFKSRSLPEEKWQIIKSQKSGSLMIGDGFNDMAALKAASLSISMPGALESSIRFADISFLKGNIDQLLKVFELAHLQKITERRLLVFTTLYNLTCLSLAFLGYVSPVVAAVLMPISSLIVLTLVSFSVRSL